VDERKKATGSVCDDQVNVMIANEATNGHGKRTGVLGRVAKRNCGFSTSEAKEARARTGWQTPSDQA